MDESKKTDSEISRGCRRNDPRAWRGLVEKYTPMVYRIAVRMLINDRDAEDVSQEVFLRVHRYISGYDPTRPLAPWLARITYNSCLKRLPRIQQIARNETPLEDYDPVDDRQSSNPAYEVGAADTRRQVSAALDRLSAQDRALLVLRYREGFTDSEIAESTRMPVGSVKSRLHRARGKLRKMLAPLFKEITT
ncbi:MAG: RNA polymerase sigma factor [Desulfobacteraceae bacterium]|nr:RNA polymerase sigma factor [Desulfobacteraceae bacterium]